MTRPLYCDTTRPARLPILSLFLVSSERSSSRIGIESFHDEFNWDNSRGGRGWFVRLSRRVVFEAFLKSLGQTEREEGRWGEGEREDLMGTRFREDGSN